MHDFRPRPLVLAVIDGWGISTLSEGNAIAMANSPHMSGWQSNYPFTALAASGLAVGLPAGQMGNSEVGHLNIGAGFIVYQDSVRISEAIHEGSFFENAALSAAINHVKKHGSQLHLMGLLGPGGVHSLSEHLYALLRLAKDHKLPRIVIHTFLDGRDTPPQSALEYLAELRGVVSELGVGQVATVSGRYYAMDRDKRWDRTEKAYQALVRGAGRRAATPEEAVQQSYAESVTDEFVLPTVIVGNDQPVATVQDNDAAIFFNFRADRARQLTRAFVSPDFTGFDRGRQLENLFFVSLTEYERGLPVEIAFPPEDVVNPLAKVISDHGLSQFHTAETEKYAHVTFFINGGREEPFPGEDRLLIPSPRVATYDLKPEMSALEVTDALIEALQKDRHDVYIVNYANPDMVGHTGILPAAIKAIETVDQCMGRIAEQVLARDGIFLITADHGNAEQMIDPQTGAPHTAHTTNPVPLYCIAPDKHPLRTVKLREGGKLADVAPTILDILGLPPAPEMTGKSLI